MNDNPPTTGNTDPADVRRIARHAIRDRLKYHAPEAIITCNTDPDRAGAVLLHVNSGGNVIAATHALRAAGYTVENVPTTEYGCKARVTGTPAPPATNRAERRGRQIHPRTMSNGDGVRDQRERYRR